LSATNPSAPGTFAGVILRGPCAYVDAYAVDTLVEITKALYGAVAALRTSSRPPDDARFHLLVPMLLIATTEAETIATLVSIDLHRTAQIHIRTLGECARRASALIKPEHAQLCVALVESLDASRKQHLDLLELDAEQRALVSEPLANATGRTFRQLERSERDKLRFGSPVEPSRMEHEAWSKWAHADILAIADAAAALRTPTEDLRVTLTEPVHATLLVLRSIDFGTMLLYVAQALGVNLERVVDDLLRREKPLLGIRSRLQQQIYGDSRKLMRTLKREQKSGTRSRMQRG
jgi:hypothetical protein